MFAQRPQKLKEAYQIPWKWNYKCEPQCRTEPRSSVEPASALNC